MRMILFPLLAGLALTPVAGDEGLWLFNQPPREMIRKKYGFNLTDDFLKKLRLGSVRFNNGGSGSFISAQGLLFTNHHVGIDCIQKLSSEANDFVKNGFQANRPEEEKACPDLEVNVLLEIQDVSAQVNAGITDSTPLAEAGQKRREAQSRIEKECADRTKNRCDVVTLFGGGQYHLYQYKKYTDVRLVFAPEYGIAFFGGDPDNFTYPRYNLDFALFRAYENGQPARPLEYFRWSKAGAKNGELTFVSGHPGSTGRLATVAELEFMRDLSYPLVLDRLKAMVAALKAYMAGSEEQRRAAVDTLASVENSLKAYTGFSSGLQDPKLMNQKREDEQRIRKAVADDPAKQAKYGKTWADIEAAYAEYRKIILPNYVLEGSAGFSELATIARHLLRLAGEKAKPNGERLREYAESRLPSLEQQLFSEAPITDSLEVVLAAEYLKFAVKTLGADHPVMRQVLAGRTPEAAAAAYVGASKLKDIAERKRLAADPQAVRESKDGMIELMRLIDPAARAVRKTYEDRVESARVSAAGKMAEIRYALYGDREYPDATFTLRLSYGKTMGYKNAAGQDVPWATNFAGMYQRATGKPPYDLPARWAKLPAGLSPKTPFNFVSTHDTHGGNSGSPTVNTRGEIVGILFDGNIEGLPNRFLFRDERERSVHVASQAILESLRKVYKAERVAREIEGK